MMRRILVLILIVGLLVAMAPLVTVAQNTDAVWDLTEKFTVQDLGIEFNYPAGWFYDTSNGIIFAESKADLRAAVDDDDKTQPDGTVFNFIAFPLTDVKQRVGKNAKLEDMADLVVELREITEKEDRVEIPVMARRTISAFGEDTNRLGHIATMWQQNDFLVVLNMLAPNYKTAVKSAYSWGQLLGSMVPTGALELSANTVSLTQVNAEIRYPDGWYPSPDNANFIYELKSDLKNQTGEGHVIYVIEQTLADLKLGKRATAEDVAEANIAILELKEPIRREEFIMLGQPAVAFRGTDGSGQFALVAQAVVDGVAVQIAIISPSEKAIDEIEPTFLTMLMSLYSTSS